MTEKKAAKKVPAKKAETKKAPEKAGRPPKLAEVTELDLGPRLSKSVRHASDRLGVPTGDVVRALVRMGASRLRATGPIGFRMSVKR